MKPFKLPRWATTALNVLEPSEGEKNTGWPAGFQPPASWQNWLSAHVYDWLRYTGGVPSGNLVIRKAEPVVHAFFDPGDNVLLDLLDVLPGLGSQIQVGSGAPADAYDEWWLGTRDAAAPGACRLWRFPAGLSGYALGIPTTGGTIVGGAGGAFPSRIIHDGTQYLLGGTDGTNAAAEVSADGAVWTNFASFGTDAFVDLVWNGQSGGSRQFLVLTDTGGTVEARRSADGTTWLAPNTVTGLSDARGVVWSQTLGLWCAVGFTGSGYGASTSPDGVTWTQSTGPALSSLNGVVVRDDGEFLAVGGLSPNGAAVAVGSTAFTHEAIVPNTFDLRNIVKIGTGPNARYVATGFEFSNSAVSVTEGVATYESYNRGISGSWRRAGQLVSPLPDGQDEVRIAQGHLIAASDDELALRATIMGTGNDGDVLISELSHPNAD